MTGLAMMIVYRAETEEGPWEPLHRDQVPRWLKEDDELVGMLRAGYMLRNTDNDKRWIYLAAEQPIDAVKH